MPYISSSGEIKENQPWGLSRLITVFWDILNFFYMFFQTLIPIGSDSSRSTQNRNHRPGGPRPPGPPRSPRGIGRISDNAPPPCFGGT